jgi:hypothetical protein
VLANVFEEAGLCTVTIAMVREHAERVKPARALFVPFPFGLALGKPNDPELQHRIIAAALDMLQKPVGPVLEDFPEDDAPATLIQASSLSKREDAQAVDAADELTTLRAYYERWVEDHDGRTAVGLCGIPQRRWRGLIRFLQAYSRGETAELKERPSDVSLEQFIRYGADDLKAFYYEARMAQRPSTSSEELHAWFWGETAMGQLLPEVGKRMAASDDPAAKAVANGIAR